jgi:hypothetical protein
LPWPPTWPPPAWPPHGPWGGGGGWNSQPAHSYPQPGGYHQQHW